LSTKSFVVHGALSTTELAHIFHNVKHIGASRAPRLAQRLLRLRVPPASREFVLGDLEEGFIELARTIGERQARRWYWQQTWRCLLSSHGKGAIPAPDASSTTRLRAIGGSASSTLRDIGFALRLMPRAPAASVAAVLTFALGIGANVAIFSVAWPALVEPLPFPDEKRLVRIDLVFVQGERSYRNPISPGDFTDLIRATSFDTLAGFNRFTSRHNLIRQGDPEQIELGFVTPEFFDVLGVPAIAGRTIDARDAGAEHRAVVLNERIWRGRFAGDPSIVGQSLNLDNVPYSVVGVVAGSAGLGTRDADAWTVMTVDPVSRIPRRGYYLGIVGRLRPGVSLDSANQELEATMARAAAEFPDINRNTTANAMLIREMLVGPIRPTLLVLLSAAALVLIVAGINLSGLQIARHLARSQEIAVRRALGASRGRLVRQFVTEGLAVAAVGGAAGLVCAWMALHGLASFQPHVTWYPTGAAPDRAVILYTIVLTAVAGLLVAFGPAWHAARSASWGLASRSRTTAGRRTIRASRLVVTTQVALTVMLLIGATLVGVSLVRVLTVDPGFEFDRGIAADVTLPGARYGDAAARARFFGELITRVESLPGVERACVINNLPLDNPGYNMTFVAGGQTRLVGSHPQTASPGCFEVLRISLVRGRLFNAVEPEPVAIVSLSMARQLWPDGADPIGRVLRVGLPDGDRLTVVGVVSDIRSASLESRFLQQVWLPPTQPYFPPQRLLVRSALPPETVATAVRGVLRDLDPGLALAHVRTMPEIVARETAPRRFVLVLLGSFAVIAVILCAVGIYGVLAQFVGQRTREIGIRIAMGAHRADVLRFVIGRVTLAVGIGTMAGLAAAWMLSHLVTHLLYDVSAHDRRVYAGVLLLVSVVSAIASWVPAARAARVDPVTALRAE
jgi:predicted permease